MLFVKTEAIWYGILNNTFQFLNNIIHIFTHFSTTQLERVKSHSKKVTCMGELLSQAITINGVTKKFILWGVLHEKSIIISASVRLCY